MRILMVAPEPVFTPRGTPFSVAFRLKAYSELGYRVDLLTYPFDKDLQFPGLRVIRSGGVPGIRAVKVGPSLGKIPLDARLFTKATAYLAVGGYDLVHTHEEAGFWGTFVSAASGLPHLYDMHSSLPQQLRNFRFGDYRPLIRLFETLERMTLRRSCGVIAICRDLYEHARRLAPGVPVALIENVLDPALVEPDSADGEIDPLPRNGGFTALYAGTFEAYQGIDLLLEASKVVAQRVPDFQMLFVGGNLSQIREASERAMELGVERNVRFLGTQPPRTVSRWMREADVLVTARTTGTNTPLKIYSYLASGRPIVATDIYSHRQVLNKQVAVMVEPTENGLAEGILRLWQDAGLRSELSRRAAAYYRNNFGHQHYVQQVQDIVRRALEHAAQKRRMRGH